MTHQELSEQEHFIYKPFESNTNVIFNYFLVCSSFSICRLDKTAVSKNQSGHFQV